MKENDTASVASHAETTLRKPTPHDAEAIWQLIERSPPLDTNSLYVYLLLTDHFRQSCVVAEHQGAIVGFLSSYLIPLSPEILFIWQIVVDEDQRGKKLALRMIAQLLQRPRMRNITRIHTTVSPGNRSSRTLFDSLANRLGVPLQVSEGYAAALFGNSGHESEPLLDIGPLNGAHHTISIS